MARRVICLLLVVALVLPAFQPFASQSIAQDGSPVPVEPPPTVIPRPTEVTEPTPIDVQTEPIAPADFVGNTPPGFYSANAIHPRADVYFTVYEITVGGQTDVFDGTNGNGIFDAPGYRTDNAKVLTLETTALHSGNFRVCIIFDGSVFANVAAVDFLRLNAGVWTPDTAERNSNTACGYAPELGVFAVAEPGSTPPSATATDVPPTETTVPSLTPTEPPTETPTPSFTPTEPPTSTPSASPTLTLPSTHTPTTSSTLTIAPPATATDLPSATPTEAPSLTATASDTPLPTDTSTSTPSRTSTISPTTPPTETNSPTSSPTPTPSETSSPTPSSTPTESPSNTATSSPTMTETPEPTSTSSATLTAIPSATASSTSPPSPSVTSTLTATVTPTASATEIPTNPPSPIQFALPNVYVTYLQVPTSGTTTGAVLSGSGLPSLSSAYRTDNPWYFSVASTVVQSGNKQLCVTFETATYFDPHRLVILQRNGSTWTQLPVQVLDSLLPEQGTQCAYISTFGDFALVERALATATVTLTPSRTPSPTATVEPSFTRTASGTATSSSTSTAFATPSPTPSAAPPASPTSGPIDTATATASSGSYPIGTTLRASASVNLRATPSTGGARLGIIRHGTVVTVTGTSVTANGYTWVPVATSLGAGWIAGNYLVPLSGSTSPTSVPPTSTGTAASPTVTRTTVPPSSSVTTTPPTPTGAPATITRTPIAPSVTRSPIASTPTRTPSRTPTRSPGSFIAGDTVRATTDVNLRSAPGTSSSVLRVVPSQTMGTITGPGVVSGAYTFYPISISGYPAGYIAGSFLQLAAGAGNPTLTRTASPTLVGNPIRYTTADVNLRQGPGTSYSIIATIPVGTQVNITGAPSRVGGVDWYPITINGVGSGWMSGAYLATTGPL